MKNVLITGGCGFVGSSLASFLVGKCESLFCLDNYFTGTKENEVEGVSYIEADVKDINLIDFDVQFDHIFHFGEYSRVEQSFEDIDLVFEYNQKSIYELLKFAKINQAKIIYSGSSTKFGDGGLNAVASPYAWTKKTNVDLIVSYAKWFDLRFAIAYFYNVYGENEISEGKYSTLIAKYLRMMKAGEKELPVVLPGTQARNFTHVDDIVEGLYLVARYGEGDGYGIGCEKSVSILEVVEMLGGTPMFLPERPGNRLGGEVVSDKTKALGWSAKRDLKSYLNNALAVRCSD